MLNPSYAAWVVHVVVAANVTVSLLKLTLAVDASLLFCEIIFQISRVLLRVVNLIEVVI